MRREIIKPDSELTASATCAANDTSKNSSCRRGVLKFGELIFNFFLPIYIYIYGYGYAFGLHNLIEQQKKINFCRRATDRLLAPGLRPPEINWNRAKVTLL